MGRPFRGSTLPVFSRFFRFVYSCLLRLVQFSNTLYFFGRFVRGLLHVISFRHFFSRVGTGASSCVVRTLPSPTKRIFLVIFRRSRGGFTTTPDGINFCIFRKPFYFFFGRLGRKGVFRRIDGDFFPRRFSFCHFLGPPRGNFPINEGGQFGGEGVGSIPRGNFCNGPINGATSRAKLNGRMGGTYREVFARAIGSCNSSRGSD